MFKERSKQRLCLVSGRAKSRRDDPNSPRYAVSGFHHTIGRQAFYACYPIKFLSVKLEKMLSQAAKGVVAMVVAAAAHAVVFKNSRLSIFIVRCRCLQ